MCYICEDQGTVGPNYRRDLKVINAALRIWKRKTADPANKQDPNGIGNPRVNWGTSRPKRNKAWTAKDFDAYQKRTRYQPVKGWKAPTC